MHIQVTQFHPPNGRTTQESTEISDSCAVGYEAIRRHNCRLTAEVLSTPGREIISLTIEHEEGDYDIEIIRRETPLAVQEALEKMLLRFDGAAFESWLQAVRA